MKLWIDDVRPAPEGYVWVKTVNEAKQIILEFYEFANKISNSGLHAYLSKHDKDSVFNILMHSIEVIDIDHDAGEYSLPNFGGDYIRLLDWLEVIGFSFPIRIHSMNPVGVENMRRIIRKNGWKEI